MPIPLPQRRIRPRLSGTREKSSFPAGDLTYILHANHELAPSHSAAGETEACWQESLWSALRSSSSRKLLPDKFSALNALPIVDLGKTTSRILVYGLCDYLRS